MSTTSLTKKVFHTIQEDGIGGCVKKTNGYIKKQIKKRRRVEKVYKDVLFISGCNENLPHPWRYRVKHQREQLEAMNYTTGVFSGTGTGCDSLLQELCVL